MGLGGKKGGARVRRETPSHANKGTSKHIAIATADVVSVGAFGFGAISPAQANPDFNPDNFTSAYSKGLDDADGG